MTTQEIASKAQRMGLTQAAFIEIGINTLEGYLNPNEDLDGQFRFLCGATGDVLKVNGWLASEITFVDQLD